MDYFSHAWIYLHITLAFELLRRKWQSLQSTLAGHSSMAMVWRDREGVFVGEGEKERERERVSQRNGRSLSPQWRVFPGWYVHLSIHAPAGAMAKGEWITVHGPDHGQASRRTHLSAVCCCSWALLGRIFARTSQWLHLTHLPCTPHLPLNLCMMLDLILAVPEPG